MWRAAVVIGVSAWVAQATPDVTQAAGRTMSRAAAEGDPATFARGVAEAGQPAGFILPLSERQRFIPPDKGQRLPFDAALKIFLARHTSYSAAFDGDTLVVRHREVPADILTALEAVRPRSAEKLTLSSALFEVLLRQLARRPVGAAAGSSPDPGPSCPIEATVAIPSGRASAIQVMNKLVTQTTGLIWLVRFGAPGESLRLQLGYVCGDGVWSAMSVPGW